MAGPCSSCLLAISWPGRRAGPVPHRPRPRRRRATALFTKCVEQEFSEVHDALLLLRYQLARGYILVCNERHGGIAITEG
jgi:hypothetical protein